LGLLLASASIAHYGNGLSFAKRVEEYRAFWWQVSWRVPQFKRGTTLVAHFPSGGIREPSFVWGPANQIYYPDQINSKTIETGIAAILLDQEKVIDILSAKENILTCIISLNHTRPRHITVVTQPSKNSCARIMGFARIFTI
jgi:hypothetical protein